MNNQDQYNPGICCYCGSDKFSIVVTGPVVPVIACAECGLMRQGFSSTAGTWSIVSYAGGKERFYRQREDKEVLQVKDYLKMLPQLEKLVPQKGHLLEIGCAMGTLLNEIRKRGWNVTGIEPEEWTCELARKNYGLRVINSTFQEAGIEDSYFDAVLMLHVIEHLPNPAKGLLQIARMIRPDGYLVVETPRYDTLWFKLLRGRERSVIPGHLYYFTRQTIQALARKSGFEVVQFESVGRTVTINRLCFYAAKFLNSNRATNILTSLSDALRLNKVRVHINLHDMMRLYLRKVV
jgi:2-polyprenyl-3-methyl-5-hydroxy-6-metoxy-1,4-benzoquinol methylase